MMSPQDEILIQRCVDNECSDVERRQLMARLDEIPDGWKNLACTYIEEQLFAAACATESNGPVGEEDVGCTIAPAKQHWFYRPLTSIALSACVVLLLGVILSGESRHSIDTDVAGTTMRIHAIDQSELVNASEQNTKGTAQGYLVQYESEGMATQELPVYDDASQFFSEYQQFQKSDISRLPDTIRSINGSMPRIRFLRLPTDSGHSVVVPIQEFQVSHRFQ